MKWLRKKPPVAPDNPATEKQINYIESLVLDVGPQSKRILKQYRINPDLTNEDAFVSLDKARASMCIESLTGMVPATENQRVTLARKGGDGFTGLSREEKADLDRAWAIASPQGDPEDPNSYRHLSKAQASEALAILIEQF